MPRESICYTNPGATQTFGIAIQRVSAPGPDPRIDVFAPDVFQLQYAVAEGSINDIAGAPEVFAVAAICRLTNAIQPYSSQGPTIDGRIRPDISGPTNVSTSFAFTPGCSGAFGGTSAASPHVAGAAALYKGALGLAPQGRATGSRPTPSTWRRGQGQRLRRRPAAAGAGALRRASRHGRRHPPGSTSCAGRTGPT